MRAMTMTANNKKVRLQAKMRQKSGDISPQMGGDKQPSPQ